VHTGPLKAPLKRGERIGTLILRPEGLPEIEAPLVADRDVAGGGFVERVTTVARILIQRLNDGPEGAS
jgi:D-alanyl-D-alanine carboxypeptidase (penicillin-binding protein 5/6)